MLSKANQVYAATARNSGEYLGLLPAPSDLATGPQVLQYVRKASIGVVEDPCTSPR